MARASLSSVPWFLCPGRHPTWQGAPVASSRRLKRGRASRSGSAAWRAQSRSAKGAIPPSAARRWRSATSAARPKPTHWASPSVHRKRDRHWLRGTVSRRAWGIPHPGGVQDPVAPGVFRRARWRRRVAWIPGRLSRREHPRAWARAQASSRAWPSRAERAVSLPGAEGAVGQLEAGGTVPQAKVLHPFAPPAENRHPPPRGGQPGDRSTGPARAIPWARMSSRGRDASGRWRSSHRAVSRTSQAASLTGSMTGAASRLVAPSRRRESCRRPPQRPRSNGRRGG